MGAVKNHFHEEICNGESGVQLNKRPETAAHAYVDRGVLYVMADGRYRAMRQFEAWSEWMTAQSSPIASTQERARQIKAALDEAYPERMVA